MKTLKICNVETFNPSRDRFLHMLVRHLFSVSMADSSCQEFPSSSHLITYFCVHTLFVHTYIHTHLRIWKLTGTQRWIVSSCKNHWIIYSSLISDRYIKLGLYFFFFNSRSSMKTSMWTGHRVESKITWTEGSLPNLPWSFIEVTSLWLKLQKLYRYWMIWWNDFTLRSHGLRVHRVVKSSKLWPNFKGCDRRPTVLLHLVSTQGGRVWSRIEHAECRDEGS